MSRSSSASALLLVAFASSSGALVAQSPSATDPAAVVDVPPDPPILALSGARPVREVRGLRQGDDVMNVRFPVVALDDPASAADLDLRLRAEVGKAVWGSLGWSHGRCVATLATNELVSVMCDLVTASERGSPARPESTAITFRLGERGARRIRVSSAFVDGTRLEQALCAKALRREPTSDDGCYFVQVALARDHLVGRWRPLGRSSRMRSIDLPYSEVASLIRPDGPLAFAAGAPPATATPALRAATPVAGAPAYLGCTIYDAPLGPVAIGGGVVRANVAHVSLSALDAGHGLFRLALHNMRTFTQAEQDAFAGAFGASTQSACLGEPTRLQQSVATRPVDLYDVPGGVVAGNIAARTHVVVFDGVVEGRDSVNERNPPGLWRYVVAAEAHGWTQDSTFRSIW